MGINPFACFMLASTLPSLDLTYIITTSSLLYMLMLILHQFFASCSFFNSLLTTSCFLATFNLFYMTHSFNTKIFKLTSSQYYIRTQTARGYKFGFPSPRIFSRCNMSSSTKKNEGKKKEY